VGFVVDKAALGQVFSEYFGSPANHSTNFSMIIISRGWHDRPIGSRSAGWTQLESTTHYFDFKFLFMNENYVIKLIPSFYISIL
jgi:hypothetical protein